MEGLKLTQAHSRTSYSMWQSCAAILFCSIDVAASILFVKRRFYIHMKIKIFRFVNYTNNQQF